MRRIDGKREKEGLTGIGSNRHIAKLESARSTYVVESSCKIDYIWR